MSSKCTRAISLPCLSPAFCGAGFKRSRGGRKAQIHLDSGSWLVQCIQCDPRVNCKRGIMKFTALCLFVILGAAVGKPVDTEQPAKAKDPVPLIVSDYSSVVKEDSSSTSAVAAAAVVPVEKSVEEVVAAAAPAEAPVAAPEAPATDAPATDAPAASDEDSLVKEFNEEVKQEEKLLTPEASNIDEVRKEQDEEVAVTTEADAAAIMGKSVVAADDVSKTEEEVAETTTEPASDSGARVVREAEEIATSTDEPKSEVATSTDEPKEGRDSSDDATDAPTTTRTE